MAKEILYTYAAASAAIKNRLTARGTTIFSPLGRPEILFKELNPAHSLVQYGGLARVIEYANGTTRILGVAGPKAEQVRNWSGVWTFHISHASLTGPGNGYFRRTGKTEAFKPTYHSVAAQFFVDVEANGTTAVAEAEANIVRELLLGWICPAEAGTIYEGRFQLQYSAEPTFNMGGLDFRTFVGNSPLTCAVLVRMPFDVTVDTPEVRAVVDASIATVDADARSYLTAAWNEYFAAHKGATRLSVPLVVGSYGNLGFEVAMNYYQRAFSDAADTGTAEWTTWMYGQGDTVWDGPNITVQTVTASKVDGYLVPRLSTLGDWSHFPGDVACPVAPPQHFVPSLPVSFGELEAAAILGPVFPGAYADAAVTKATTFEPSALAFPADTVVLHPAPVNTTGATASDAGNATTSALVGVTSTITTSSTMGGDLLSHFKAAEDWVYARAEAKARADRPLSL